ncbi:sugar ABC transporter permease, partial [Escherichia coli]
MRAKYFPYLVLLPTLVFLFAFTYFPLLRSVIDSLYDTRLNADQPRFIGLDNFIRLLHDDVFWQALLNNVLYI